MIEPILYWGLHQWSSSKQLFEDFIPLDNAVLHLAAGLLMYLAVSLSVGSTRARWFGWLTVVIVAIVNEVADISLERWPDAALQYQESIFDLAWTLALPSLLVAVSLFRSRAAHSNRLG